MLKKLDKEKRFTYLYNPTTNAWNDKFYAKLTKLWEKFWKNCMYAIIESGEGKGLGSYFQGIYRKFSRKFKQNLYKILGIFFLESY